jgi:DNA-binding CsgD family transcriptional regulator
VNVETHAEMRMPGERTGWPVEVRVLELCGLGSDLMGAAFSPSGEVIHVTPTLQTALHLTGEGSVNSRLGGLLSEEPPEGFELKGEIDLGDGFRLFVLGENRRSRLDRVLDAYAGRHRLTPAERAALAHVADGLSAKVSAGLLKLSPETVRARRKRIFRKVGTDGCGGILAQLLRE